MEAVVLFDYDKQQDDELDLKVGMVIQNVTQVDDGWCEGTFEGQTGMFPDNFVQLQPVSSQPPLPPTTKQSKPPPPDPTPSDPPVVTRPLDPRTKSRRAKVTFSYAAENPDELTLQPGQVVEVIGEEEDGWWKGRIGERSGLFPSNFVEELPEEQPSPSHPPQSTSSTHAAPPTHAPQPAPSTHPPPVSHPPAPSPHVTGGDRTDGPPPPRAGGPMGPQIFPTGFNPADVRLKRAAAPPPAPKEKEKEEIKMPQLKKVAPPPPKSHGHGKAAPPLPHEPQVEKAKVIYAYNSEHEDELTIKVGDILEVVDKNVQDGWWEVRLGGRTGLVPDNFVEVVPHQAPHTPAKPPPPKEPMAPVRPPAEPPSKKDLRRPVPPVHAPEEKADLDVPATTLLDNTPLKNRPKKPVGSRPPSRSNLLEESRGEQTTLAPWQEEMKKKKARVPLPKPEEKKLPPPKAAVKPPLSSAGKPPITSKPSIDTKPPPPAVHPTHPPTSSTTSEPSTAKSPAHKPPEVPVDKKDREWREELEKLREEFQLFKEKIQLEVQTLADDLDKERKENAVLKIDIDRLKKTRL